MMSALSARAAREVAELWHEYEAAASPEALLVKDFDKLEMIIQVCAGCQVPYAFFFFLLVPGGDAHAPSTR